MTDDTKLVECERCCKMVPASDIAEGETECSACLAPVDNDMNDHDMARHRRRRRYLED